MNVGGQYPFATPGVRDGKTKNSERSLYRIFTPEKSFASLLIFPSLILGGSTIFIRNCLGAIPRSSCELL